MDTNEGTKRTNTQIIFVERPKGYIEPGKTFVSKSVPAPTADTLKDGQILAEVLYVSVEPAMRGWMQDRRSYIKPLEIGSVMRSYGLVRVLASRSSKATTGQVVVGMCGWQEVCMLSEAEFEVPMQAPPAAGLRELDQLGFLGLTGLTAYMGIVKIGCPQPGQTVVVSGVAGATGSVAAQIAKAMGAKVIGIAGGVEKCCWAKEHLGLDDCIDYKTSDWKDHIIKATPDFVDVYYDNVGGETLDFMLTRAHDFARYVICGAISQYNVETPYGLKNFTHIITQRIRLQGFIVTDFKDEYNTARKALIDWAAAGKIKRTETIYKGGIQKAENALFDLFKGKNTGKMLVELKSVGDMDDSKAKF